MAHTLVKEKKVTFIPGHPAVPAYPGQPWMPARITTKTIKVCRYVQMTVFRPLYG